MIAAVVQTSEGELTLYQAIEVANLLGCVVERIARYLYPHQEFSG